MEFELPKERSSIIKVIGVGGGGSNAVNHMYQQGIKGVDFVVCNTDQQALDVSPVINKIQLGISLTEGRGAGSLPEVGKNAAIENSDDIRRILEVNTKMVFITAGMGGGTGTGAAPVIAGIAKELGILTVAIVTMPFGFEGRKREMQAREGLEQLKKNVDTILIIKNDKLREIHGNLKLKEAFEQADNVLSTAAKSIAEIITKTYNMNVDFADVNTVMNSSGVAIMGSAKASGENRALVAVQKALESPLLNDNNIEGARYILLNIVSGESEVTMDEFGEITSYVQDAAGHTAELIIGSGSDDELNDEIAVTIIATGFKTSLELNDRKPEKVVMNLEPVIANTPKPEVKVEEPVQPVMQAVQLSIPDAKEEEIKEESKEDMFVKMVVEESKKPIELKEAMVEMPKMKESFVASTVHKLFSTEEKRDVPPTPTASANTEEMSDQSRKASERIMRLKELSLKIKSPGGINDLEKVPAYVRRNVKMENEEQLSSAPSQISRYTLSDNDEGKPEIRPNNSFLHDNVD